MLSNKTTFVDFHCHYDLLPTFGRKSDAQLSDVTIVAVTTTPLAWSKNLEISGAVDGVIPALGMHPQLISSRAKDFEQFSYYLEDTRIVGEVGLDGSKNFSDSLPTQEKIFSNILSMCNSESPKILSIHSLKAESKVISHLKEHVNRASITPIMHWFTGSVTQASKLLDMGAKFSFNQKMLKTKSGQKLLMYLPRDSVLTETDLPFTSKSYSPEAHRELLVHSVDMIASFWGTSLEDCTEHLLKNSNIVLSEK
ncbi:Qat anti-phage system TatD family nuclease QatD [Pseudoalteromonas xiamenensis]